MLPSATKNICQHVTKLGLQCSFLLMRVDNDNGVVGWVVSGKSKPSKLSKSSVNSPQKPYSTSVGGARSLSRRSLPETDATAESRPRRNSLMLPQGWRGPYSVELSLPMTPFMHWAKIRVRERGHKCHRSKKDFARWHAADPLVPSS